MTKKKRVTRKQLLKEPDEFITFSGKIIQAGRRYRSQLLYTTIGVLAILVVITGFRYYSAYRLKRGFSSLDRTLVKYEQFQKSNGVSEAYEGVKAEFDQMIDKYSGNDAGKIIRLTYADICFQAGDFDTAIILYEKALRDFQNDPFYRKLIQGSMGHALVAKKNLSSAAAFFLKITASPEPFLKDEALFHLGKLHELMGESEKSKAFFRKIATDHPSSLYINVVNEKYSG